MPLGLNRCDKVLNESHLLSFADMNFYFGVLLTDDFKKEVS